MAKNLTYTQCGDYLIPGIRLEHKGTQMWMQAESTVSSRKIFPVSVVNML